MAYEQSYPSPLMQPAHLFIGPHEKLIHHVEQHLQTLFCAHNACNVCSQCDALRKRQHHAVQWFTPEKRYVIEDLHGIFETTALALNAGDHFFFILEKADLLTTASANKLLKILEEPPAGYHFILCTDRSDALLPTIVSRCTITSFYESHHTHDHEDLARFFTYATTINPNEFLKALESSKITEHESAALVDYLISYWTEQYKHAVHNNDLRQQSSAQRKVDLFTSALKKLPMPGSSKIFWKNLFLKTTAEPQTHYTNR